MNITLSLDEANFELRRSTSLGWFYSFKLYLVINDYGEILAFILTLGNADHRKPVSKQCDDRSYML